MKTVELLSGTVPFEDLSRQQLENIAATLRPVHYAAGEQLIRHGDTIRVVGLISDGRIILMIHTSGGNMLKCGTLCSGDFLVDPGLMTSGKSVVSAYAETPVLCHVQALKDYWAMVEAHPQIKEFFYKRAMIQLIKTLETLNGTSKDDPWCQAEQTVFVLAPRAVRKALLYIEKNYTEPLTLQLVAQINGMSKYHFSRVFKEETGYTFKAYVNRRRIEGAKYFMEHEQKNVSEAAFTVGYNDLSYFSRLFRKLEGLSPSEYRKALKIAH
jgi:AraC-like DNA-binding protein